MDIDDFAIDEGALAQAEAKREEQLAEDEREVERSADDNDCGGACSI